MMIPRRFLKGILPAAVLMLFVIPQRFSRADDWPQWLGPKRDGIWREQGLIETFPKEGPLVRWRTPVGAGYAGPAVAGGRVFVLDRVTAPGAKPQQDPFQRGKFPGVERVLCFSEADGKPLWEHKYDCPYTMSYAAGPRATPTVDGDRVYTVGGEGHLFCLNVADGSVVWSKRLGDDGATPMWGYSAHPLVDGDRLICVTTGKAHLTAFNKKTGEVLWTALSAKEPGYSPPMIYEAAGRRQLIAWHPEAVNSVDPETGKLYWRVPFGPAQNGVTIMTPQLLRDPKLGELLFVSTQYEGGLMLKLGKDDKGNPTATELWKGGPKDIEKGNGLRILIPSPVMRDGVVYGVSARGEFRCIDAATGERRWETATATTYDAGPQSWATAFLTPIGETGDRFIIANEHGDLIRARLSPKAYTETSRTHLLDPTNTLAGRAALWCYPAYANRSIYWRNDKELVCASLAAEGAR
jgi:outer membrane protein assembly factor BamB